MIRGKIKILFLLTAAFGFVIAGCQFDPPDTKIFTKDNLEQSKTTTTPEDYAVYLNYRMLEVQQLLQWGLDTSLQSPEKVSYDESCKGLMGYESEDLLIRTIVLNPKRVQNKDGSVSKYSCRLKTKDYKADGYANETFEFRYRWKSTVDRGLIERWQQGRYTNQFDKEELYTLLARQRELIQFSYRSSSHQVEIEPKGELRGRVLINEDRTLLAIKSSEGYDLSWSVGGKVSQYLVSIRSKVNEDFRFDIKGSGSFIYNPIENWLEESKDFYLTYKVPSYERFIEDNEEVLEEFTRRNFVDASFYVGVDQKAQFVSPNQEGKSKTCLSMQGGMNMKIDGVAEYSGKLVMSPRSDRRSTLLKLDKDGGPVFWPECTSRRSSHWMKIPYNLIMAKMGV